MCEHRDRGHDLALTIREVIQRRRGNECQVRDARHAAKRIERLLTQQQAVAEQCLDDALIREPIFIQIGVMDAVIERDGLFALKDGTVDDHAMTHDIEQDAV